MKEVFYCDICGGAFEEDKLYQCKNPYESMDYVACRDCKEAREYAGSEYEHREERRYE